MADTLVNSVTPTTPLGTDHVPLGRPANSTPIVASVDGLALYISTTTSMSGTYAPLAKGVTNGDSHDHVGGDGAAITEAAISLSNVTTNNASATKHGFLPKLDNTGTKYLRDDGTWQPVTGGGGSTNAFGTVSVAGQSNVVAASAPDSINFVGGTDINITTNAGTKTVTFSANVNTLPALDTKFGGYKTVTPLVSYTEDGQAQVTWDIT